MQNDFEKSKNDFDNWVDKWDKALQSDIFKSSSIPSTSKQTSDNSFFGLRQDNPTDSIDPSDAQYWSAINSVADGGVEMTRLDEEELKFKPYNSPNPIRKGTEGPDQDLSDRAIDATFGEEDVRNLEEMKIKLHDLGSKVAEMTDKSYESQVNSLIEKIDELSNKMCGKK